MEDLNTFQVVLGVFSVLATGFAAYAAFVMPRSAAVLAEKLRRQNDQQDSVRRRKEEIFIELIQIRGITVSRSATKALNLVDFAFLDNPTVRDAYSELFNTYQRSTDFAEQQKYLELLISAIAKDLGIDGSFRHVDVTRVYVPRKITEEQEAEHLELQARLKKLRFEQQNQIEDKR